MTVAHDTLVMSRSYSASPSDVFAAWAQPELKAKWFAIEGDWVELGRSLDFREGGDEHWTGRSPGGQTHRYSARFADIVIEERIVFTYTMTIDQRRISVSLATVELTGFDGGTRLTLTEQAAFLDGLDDAEARRGGFSRQLDALRQLLTRR